MVSTDFRGEKGKWGWVVVMAMLAVGGVVCLIRPPLRVEVERRSTCYLCLADRVELQTTVRLWGIPLHQSSTSEDEQGARSKLVHVTYVPEHVHAYGWYTEMTRTFVVSSESVRDQSESGGIVMGVSADQKRISEDTIAAIRAKPFSRLPTGTARAMFESLIGCATSAEFQLMRSRLQEEAWDLLPVEEVMDRGAVTDAGPQPASQSPTPGVVEAALDADLAAFLESLPEAVRGRAQLGTLRFSGKKSQAGAVWLKTKTPCRMLVSQAGVDPFVIEFGLDEINQVSFAPLDERSRVAEDGRVVLMRDLFSTVTLRSGDVVLGVLEPFVIWCQTPGGALTMTRVHQPQISEPGATWETFRFLESLSLEP